MRNCTGSNFIFNSMNKGQGISLTENNYLDGDTITCGEYVSVDRRWTEANIPLTTKVTPRGNRKIL